MNFKNKIAVITGASGGIGNAVAGILVSKGVKIFSLDLQPPEKEVDGITYIKTDITKAENIKKALAKISEPIDILFNNAGVMKRGKILEASEEDFDLLFNVHVKGSWLMLKHAQEFLAKDATIIQMSSRHALYFPSDPGLYALVKRASLSLAELVEQTYPNYRVKILCPGPVDTPLSHEECNDDEWDKKKKMVCEPAFLAEQILELIMSEKSKLIFDQKSCNYYFE